MAHSVRRYGDNHYQPRRSGYRNGSKLRQVVDAGPDVTPRGLFEDGQRRTSTDRTPREYESELVEGVLELRWYCTVLLAGGRLRPLNDSDRGDFLDRQAPNQMASTLFPLTQVVCDMDPDRAEGVLLGLACGDALGRPVEFRSPDQIDAAHGRLSEMVGDGTWGQPPGTITDDTEQALCIARSIADRGEFDPADVADRFVAWYETGPFDIGNMTRRSLRALRGGQSWDVGGEEVWRTSPEGANAGNGSVMRCPPIAISHGTDADELIQVSRDSSRITHADPRCTYGSAVLNLTTAGLLTDRDRPLAEALDHVRSEAPKELVDALAPIAAGESPSTLSTSGYVVDTLQTALHDALDSESPEDAIVTAVNRGGDTDTIGAVAGAAAGARFGATGLPDSWLAELNEESELRLLARDLLELDGP